MSQLRYFIEFVIYTIIAFGFVSPCHEIWGFEICAVVSMVLGFTWGLLNEIRAELMVLNDSIKKNKK